MFVGFASLDALFSFPVLTVNTSGLPTDATGTPTYRVYGAAGFMLSGSLAFKETGVVTGATNASPIVITSVNHKLTTGMKVTVASVGGNTAANGVFTITVLTADTFSLNGSTGNGAYTSGGTWSVTGWYACAITPTEADGYAAGLYYDILAVATISGNVVEEVFRFGVAG